MGLWPLAFKSYGPFLNSMGHGSSGWARSSRKEKGFNCHPVCFSDSICWKGGGSADGVIAVLFLMTRWGDCCVIFDDNVVELVVVFILFNFYW